MFKKSRLAALFLAAVLSLIAVIPAYAATTAGSGRIYGDEDIIDDIQDVVWEKIEDSWKATDLAGDPVSGWVKRSGLQYFTGKDGFEKTGWIKDKGKWYYLYTELDNVNPKLIGTLATSTWINNYFVNEYGELVKTRRE